MLFKKILFLITLFSFDYSLYSQDNQRYFALSLVNIDPRNPQLVDIQKAADLGMNAVIVSVRRDVVVDNIINNPSNTWEQYDNQLKTAKERGMKICLRIVMSSWCNYNTPGGFRTNNLPTCNGFDASERMLGISEKSVERVQQQSAGYAGCDKINDCGQVLMTSFSAPKTITVMQDFTLNVLKRYKSYIDNGDILYVCAVVTPEQELGYPLKTTIAEDYADPFLFDYSQSMINSYREWLKIRYKNDISNLKKIWGQKANKYNDFSTIEPPKPFSTFNWTVFLDGFIGQDWYIYRHQLLKKYSQELLKVVKKFDSRLKVINDFGSVNDRASVQRGTFSFKDIGEGTDGVKINTSPDQDHRFVMDVARTNFPDKWVMNEVESYQDDIFRQEQQFTEAYTHGAKLVSAFNFNILFSPIQQDMLKRVSQKFIVGKQQVQNVETCGTTICNIGDLIGDNGCAYKKNDPNSDCRAYRDWANLKKANGNKPVRIVLDESFATDIPFKVVQKDLSACGSVTNFKETYLFDCQKLNAKTKAPANLKGMIESANCQQVSGWALNTSNLDEIQLIDIYADSVKIGTTQANVGNRPDLVTTFNSAKANFRGFTFILPDTAWYKSGQVKKIYARFANTNTLLDDNNEAKFLVCEGTGSGICGQKYRLIISPDSLTNVLSKETDYKITVSSNAKWKITKNVSWLTTSIDTSSFNGSFTLKVLANPDTGTRRGKVFITAAGVFAKSITIAQKGVGQPYLTVSPDSITTLSASAAEYKILVNSNVKIKVSNNFNWVSTDPSTDIQNGSFNLKIEANSDTGSRKGKIVLTGIGTSKSFYLTQKGKGKPCTNCNGTVDTDKPITDPNSTSGQLAPTTFRGWIETANCCNVSGWAFNSQNYDDILSVDIFLDNKKLGSAIANRGYRTDLATNYQSDKLLYKSFCFPIPRSILDSFTVGKNKQFFVRFGGTITKLYTPENRFIYCNSTINCTEEQLCKELSYQDYLETVFPNPSDRKFTLSLYSVKNQGATLKLVDMQGLILKQIQYNLNLGLNNIELDTEGIRNGSLLLSIALENGNILFKRLVKLE